MADEHVAQWQSGSKRVTQREQVRDGEGAWIDRKTDEFGRWIETHPKGRWAVIIGMLVLTLPPGLILLWSSSFIDNLGGWAYGGVFLVNLLANIPIIPIPGLSTLGQAVIITQAANRELPWLVGVAGGLGMGLGEIPVYYTGTAGRHAAKGKRVPGPGWFRHSVEWVGRVIERLMKRHGVITIFILSAIPNPALEVAGLSAGASGLGFWRFIAPLVAGKLVRGMILVYLAQYIPFI